MEGQIRRLFQMEDGTPLTFAIHEDVPQHDRLREMITVNYGLVTEDLSSADFTILSTSILGIDSIVSVLRGEGKIALQEWWIRNSVDAGKLLPWYPYVIANETDEQKLSDSQRDLHELTVVAARYWPLLVGERLYQFVVRRCPHLSIAQCRALCSSDKATFDSSVSFTRHRIHSGLAPGGSLIMPPRLSFGSPNKLWENRPSIMGTSEAPQQTPSPIIPLTPTSMRRELSGGAIIGRETTAHRSEGPEPGSNLEQALDQRQTKTALTTETPDASGAKNGQRQNPTNHKSSAGHPITTQDIDALARWVMEHNRSEYPSQEKYMAAFQAQYHGSKRKALSWSTAMSRHEAKILQRVEALKRGQPLPTDESLNTEKKAPKGQRVTDEEINAMALYMLDHPRGKMTLKSYYAAFQAQYTGSSRNPDSWNHIIRAHELKITSRMNAILDERNGVSTHIELDTPVPAPALVSENRSERTP